MHNTPGRSGLTRSCVQAGRASGKSGADRVRAQGWKSLKTIRSRKSRKAAKRHRRFRSFFAILASLREIFLSGCGSRPDPAPSAVAPGKSAQRQAGAAPIRSGEAPGRVASGSRHRDRADHLLPVGGEVDCGLCSGVWHVRHGPPQRGRRRAAWCRWRLGAGTVAGLAPHVLHPGGAAGEREAPGVSRSPWCGRDSRRGRSPGHAAAGSGRRRSGAGPATCRPGSGGSRRRGPCPGSSRRWGAAGAGWRRRSPPGPRRPAPVALLQCEHPRVVRVGGIEGHGPAAPAPGSRPARSSRRSSRPTCLPSSRGARPPCRRSSGARRTCRRWSRGPR